MLVRRADGAGVGMDLGLDECTAVVTGAGRGIGLATAEALAAEGVRVLGVTRTGTPELAAVAEVLKADLVAAAAAATVAETVSRWSPAGVDVLVNGVGGGVEGEPGADGFDALDDGRWAATLELNLLSAVRVTRALIGSLLARGGTIVSVSSIGARIADQPIDYGVAKAALNRLTTGLSEEYAARGVRAVTVSPGPTSTDAWTAPDGMTAEMARRAGMELDDFLAKLPGWMGATTGRFTEPAEVGALIAFLASPRADNLTGVDVVLDGGVTKTV